jgi:hypothetical protein
MHHLQYTGGDDYTPNFQIYNQMNYEFPESGPNFIVPSISIDDMNHALVGNKGKNQLSPSNQTPYDKAEDGSMRKSPGR